MNIKKASKKIWDFLWKSNSIWSWIADLIIIFLIVKFIFFPVFGLIFASPLPFVIIESDSMHHSGDFDSWFDEFGSWYEKNGIKRDQIIEWPYSNGLDKGDIMVVVGKEAEEYRVGDVIVFNTKAQQKPIIHRIVGKEEKDGEILFSTKGDNNVGQLLFWGLNIEKEISTDRIVGRASFRIPWFGWVKLIFAEAFSVF